MVRKNTWIVLGILAVLSGFVLYLQNKPTGTEEVIADELLTPVQYSVQTPLFETIESPSQIRELSVTTLAGDEFHMVRKDDGDWVMFSPVVKPTEALDLSFIEMILFQIISIYTAEMNETVNDLAQVGLTEPSATVQISLMDGSATTLFVGDKTPLGASYFVQVDDGAVIVIEGFYVDAFLSLIDSPPILPLNQE